MTNADLDDPGAALNPGSMCILVVDDEVLIRAMISAELRSIGHTVIEAANVDEALSVLRSLIRVDVVLTDMRMPGALDGAALVQIVRTEFPFIRVVMVAGQAPESSTHALLDGFVKKPFSPTHLTDLVQSFVKGPA